MRVSTVAGVAIASLFWSEVSIGQAQQGSEPLVTGDLTVYYGFDSVFNDGFDNFFPDGSGNNLHGLVLLGDNDANEDGLDDIRLDTEDKIRGAGSARFDTDTSQREDRVAVCDQFAHFVGCEDAADNDLIPTDGFTVAAWVKVDDVGADHSIWQSRADGGGFIHTQIQGGGGLRFRLRGDANSDNIVQFNELPGGETIPFGEWIHYAGTYERTDPSLPGEWAVYYNGDVVGGGDANGSVAGTDAEVLGNWGMGGLVGLVPDFNRQLVGSIDEFYLFRRALSEQEIAVLANPSPPNPSDCNGDGVVDANDLSCVHLTEDPIANRDLVLATIPSLPGDLDGNGEVAFADFLVLSTNFSKDLPAYTDGNIDLSGPIDFSDFLILSANFGKTPTAAATASAVPEPSAMALGVFGCLFALTTCRRKRA